MAICEVAPAPGPFLDTIYLKQCSLLHTKRDCYVLWRRTATMHLQIFDVSLV